MDDISDRFLILLIGAVGLGSIFVAWFFGYAQATLEWADESVVVAGLAILLLLVLVGFYLEFWELDREAG